MTSIRWTSEAADEFEAQIQGIREDDPEAAGAMAQTILDRIARCRDFPVSGALVK